MSKLQVSELRGAALQMYADAVNLRLAEGASQEAAVRGALLEVDQTGLMKQAGGGSVKRTYIPVVESSGGREELTEAAYDKRSASVFNRPAKAV